MASPAFFITVSILKNVAALPGAPPETSSLVDEITVPRDELIDLEHDKAGIEARQILTDNIITFGLLRELQRMKYQPLIDELYSSAARMVRDFPKHKQLPILVEIKVTTYLDGAPANYVMQVMTGFEVLDKSDEEEFECVICLTKLPPGLMVTRLPCSHVYHPKCIVSWIETSPSCPVCHQLVPCPPGSSSSSSSNNDSYAEIKQALLCLN